MLEEKESWEQKVEKRSQFRILIVSEKVEISVSMSETLEAMGCESLGCVFDGIEAVRVFEQVGYDLIFMSLELSNMDGFEVTRRIREFEKGLGAVNRARIIGMSSFYRKEDVEDLCLEVGMDGFFRKPIEVGDLARILESCKKPGGSCEK